MLTKYHLPCTESLRGFLAHDNDGFTKIAALQHRPTGLRRALEPGPAIFPVVWAILKQVDTNTRQETMINNLEVLRISLSSS